jgi:hypothetical protein
VLLIETSIDTGYLLYRFAADGRGAGDTWHPTVDEAKGQAAFEYGDALEGRHPVPKDIEDVDAFLRTM